jgi:hypothetical protein
MPSASTPDGAGEPGTAVEAMATRDWLALPAGVEVVPVELVASREVGAGDGVGFPGSR